jgi:hypothetical protein
MRLISLLIALTVVLGGCAVQKMLIPTGGSRADGTVEMSYEFGLFEAPVVNLQQGAEAAKQRCAAWGYSGAEAFGGQRSQCQQRDGMGTCTRTLVTVPYQCTGMSGAH